MRSNHLGVIVFEAPTMISISASSLPDPPSPRTIPKTTLASLLFLVLFLAPVGAFAWAGAELSKYSFETREFASLVPIGLLGVGYWVGEIFTFNMKLERGFSKHQLTVLALYFIWTPLAWTNLVSARRSLYALAVFTGGVRTLISWWLSASLLNNSFHPSKQQYKGAVLSLTISVMWDVAVLLVFAD